MALAGFPPMETDAKTDALSTSSMPWQSPDASVDGMTALPQILETRCCELCGATQTPMWRRGPSGKGSVCNACGVRWASRRRGPRRNMEDYAMMHSKEASQIESEATGGALEQYFCKYCGLTWPLNYFKNRQQFGAHCSNCSRKRKSRDVHPSMQGLGDLGESGGQTSPRMMSLSGFGGLSGSVQGSSDSLGLGPHGLRPLQIPRKVPRDDLHLPALKSRAAHLSSYGDHEDPDDFLPPAKKFKSFQPASPDSGDETYADSDSETVSSPYGPSTNSLFRLLGAVENVLTEEREMSTMLSQMCAVRAMIDSLDETRKVALNGLEHTVMGQLDHIQHLISPENIGNVIEKEQAEAAKQETTSNSVDIPTAPSTVPGSEPTTETAQQSPIASAPKPTTTSEDATSQEVAALRTSILAVEAAEADIESAMGPHVEKPITLAPVPEVELPAALEAATRDLVAVFANATLLQMGSNADIEAFKNCFVHVLNQSKVNINQDVATLFEALVNLKKRQTQLGQGTFIDHLQLRQINSDLHNLKQRVVHSSRAVQSMFVQLVTQFTEQIETAKRIYQENAGNHVRLLDEVVRARLAPALTHDIDQLRTQLLAHINCVHANMAYLDNLVLTSE